MAPHARQAARRPEPAASPRPRDDPPVYGVAYEDFGGGAMGVAACEARLANLDGADAEAVQAGAEISLLSARDEARLG